MKKQILSLLSLSALLALTGCTTTVISYKEVVVEEKVTPTRLVVDEPGLVMFVGETYQLHLNVYPISAADANIVYKSNKTGVATVSKDGLVTAKGAGTAKIKIYAKDNPDVSEEVVVAVEKNKITSTNKDKKKAQRKDVSNKMKNQKAVQDKKYYVKNKNTIDKVNINNGYRITTYVDGEHYYSENVRQNFTAGKSQGFFYFEVNDIETRSPGGNPSFDNFGYYMFCNENFDAHAYKYSDSSAKRAYISAEDYIGKVDRIEVVMMMLDNIFTSQRKILTNQFDNALERSDLSKASFNKGGYTNDGKTSCGIAYSSSIPTYTISASEEDDLDIPAGTVISIDQAGATHWRNGRVDASYSKNTFTYDLDGHHYVHTEEAFTNVYIEKEVDIVYPNKDDFEEVATFIDLFV